MSSLIIEGSSDTDSATRKHDKREVWTEEQKAFAVYHRDLGAPFPAVASLLNAKFELSRSDRAVATLIRRVSKAEGEKKRLLEIASRQPWKKITNEEKNASNRTAVGCRVYSDEQRSYAIYYSARGFSVPQIVSLFNEQFSMDVTIMNMKKLIWRTSVKENEGGEALKAAEQYSWHTQPVPQKHRSVTSTQPVQESTNDPAAIFQEKYPLSSRDWTKEQKAFIIHHKYRNMKEDALIELFNDTFRSNRKKLGLQVVLKHIWRDDKLVDHLRQHAQQFDWYTPEAAPGTPESLNIEKAQRMREARKRISVRKEFYAKVPKDGDFSRFLRPGQPEHVRRTLLDSGSYSSRHDDDDVPSTSRLHQIPSTFDSGREENLPNMSPLALRTTNDRTQSTKNEFRDNTTQGISSFRQSEPRRSKISGGYGDDLLNTTPLTLRTTNDKAQKIKNELPDNLVSGISSLYQDDQYANDVSSGCDDDEDLLNDSPTTLRTFNTKIRREARSQDPFIGSFNRNDQYESGFGSVSASGWDDYLLSESPLTQRTANHRTINGNHEFNVTASRHPPEDLSAVSHSSARRPSSGTNRSFRPDADSNPSGMNRSFRPNADFDSSGMNRSFRPNANLNSSIVDLASRPNDNVNVNTSSVNHPSRHPKTFHPSYSHSAYGPPTMSAYGPPTMSAYGPALIQIPNPTPLPLSSPHSRGHDVLHDWAPLSPGFAVAADHQAAVLDRRSRSPRKVKEERFMIGDEDDEGNGKGFLRVVREGKGEGPASRYREPLGRYEERR